MEKQTLNSIRIKSEALLGNLKTFSPSPMTSWQLQGFMLGILCGGLHSDEADDYLIEDILDEAARAHEEFEPAGFQDGPPQACVSALGGQTLEIFEALDDLLSEESGELDLPFALAESKPASIPFEARDFAKGLLRGVVFAVEDEKTLEEEAWTEVLGLLFILSEDTSQPEFGSKEEIFNARAAVVSGLSGIVLRLYECGLALG